MYRRSGIRFADKDMRQYWNLQRFPFIWDHRVIPYERKKRCSCRCTAGASECSSKSEASGPKRSTNELLRKTISIAPPQGRGLLSWSGLHGWRDLTLFEVE